MLNWFVKFNSLICNSFMQLIRKHKKITKWQKPKVKSPNFTLGTCYLYAHKPQVCDHNYSSCESDVKGDTQSTPYTAKVIFKLSVGNLTKKLYLSCFKEKEHHKTLKPRYLSQFFCVVFSCWCQDWTMIHVT